MRGRVIAGALAVAVGPVGWCLALGAIVGGDPMLAIEVGGAALVALWSGFLAQDVLRSRRLASALARGARDEVLFGVRVQVTSALDRDAVVVGAIRPVIYLGAALLATLADDELQAVVYHEDHHRRTRAPLRAAALHAWLRLLGRSHRVRHLLHDRIAALEVLADADAIERGASPRSLARALLKGEPGLQPAAFSCAADRRVEHLLDRAAGIEVEAPRHLPYEWLPVAVLAIVVLGCNAAL